jgi:hypothetical protein
MPGNGYESLQTPLIMRFRILIAMAIAMFVVACSEQSCPTYGSHYTYSPPRKKLFKSSGSSGKKQVKRAEQ